MNHWLNVDFARAIKRHPNTRLQAYGPNCYEGYPDITVQPYHESLKLRDLHRQFPFQIVILCTKSRAFDRYLPPIYLENLNKDEQRGKCWLPEDFADFPCPKVVLEEDYHYELNDDWYAENDIKVIFQRHWASANRTGKVRNVWLPFSVDTDTFKPDPATDMKRIKKICFNGSESKVYCYRNTVRALLRKTGWLDDFENKKRERNYLRCLQTYVAHLSCSSIYDITPAKMFEIMASGSVLWTNECNRYGINDLFPPDAYCTYREDYLDVEEKAQQLISDESLRQRITTVARDCILSRHTHKIRINELLVHLRELLR